MGQDIYEKILKNSELAYFKGTGIKDENGNYIDLIILDFNTSFKKLIKLKSKSIKDILRQANLDIKVDSILKSAMLNEKCKIDRYIPRVNQFITIDIYFISEDVFAATIHNENSKTYMNLSEVFRSAPISTWVKDVNGRYIYVNDQFLSVLGCEYEAVIGKTDEEIWGRSQGKCFAKNDKFVIREGKVNRCEETWINTNGEKIYLQSTKWPYRDDDGKIVGLLGTFINITDKIKLNESIEKNEANFQEIAKYSESVFIIRDRKKATYVSPSFEYLFEAKPDKLYNDINSLGDYFYESYIVSKDSNSFDTPMEVTAKLKNKSKEEKWVWIKFVPIKDENGNTIKRIGVISDATKRKKIEEEMEQFRLDFFANISHELRTPINLILSAIQVLDLKVKNLSEENKIYFKRYMDIMQQNGFRMLKLVNNLIDITKIDSGYLKYSPQNINIVSFVEEICMSVSDFISRNNMEIVFDTDVEEKIIGFDPDKVERIMLNLISNAIKFNKQNGMIKVEINCDDEKYIKIKVKDTGIGIPQEKINNIFKRFEQVKSKMKNEREGSGIGLSLVKSLIEINKGNITVNSQLGEGSEFIVSLPNSLSESIYLNTEIMINSVQSKRINVEFSDIYV